MKEIINFFQRKTLNQLSSVHHLIEEECLKAWDKGSNTLILLLTPPEVGFG